MKVYLVTYDLKKFGKDYTGLYTALKSSYNWWHQLDSTWLVATNESLVQVWNRIAPHLDLNDIALVIEVKRNYQGWLPKDAWDWINAYVPY